jgi:hypothetical protein
LVHLYVFPARRYRAARLLVLERTTIGWLSERCDGRTVVIVTRPRCRGAVSPRLGGGGQMPQSKNRAKVSRPIIQSNL